MNVKTEKTQQKIELLTALIDHPRTGEAERDAARRMLQRAINKADTEDAPTRGSGHVDRRSYGAKYDHQHRLSITDIAKLIREDIKLARKIAQRMAEPGALAITDPIATAPAEIKFGVRSEHFAGGGAIDITVKNIPAAWGWTERVNERGYTVRYVAPALKVLAVDLRQIMDAYNHNGSDLFDLRFYGRVTAEGGPVLA